MKDDQTILQTRAKKVAGRSAESTVMGAPLLVVEFLLIPEKYCIASAFVVEVLPLREITQIPGAPAFVIGVINVRGKILSVVNLKTFFHLDEKGLTELNKIIVIRQNLMEFGIVVDSISGTREISLKTLSAAPVTINGLGAEYIKGVTPDGLILLEMASILSSKSLIVNQK
jgi:purine-binding chemotaxis protein CheW